MKDIGFIKAAAACPKLRVANTEYNSREIIKLIHEAEENGAGIVVFPELCITGYTCADLFGQRTLLEGALKALQEIMRETEELKIISLVGIPLAIDGRLYNCAAVIKAGQILGIVPKMYIPNYKEFYEKRWFALGGHISEKTDEIHLLGKKVPFGNLLFKDTTSPLILGIEICEDLWVPIPPSSYLAISGANLIANLSASNELVAKRDYKRSLVSQQSARCMCGYIYSSAGVHESTTDLVFGGDCMIAENGSLLKESDRFDRENFIIYSEIDIERLLSERLQNKSFSDSEDYSPVTKGFRTVEVNEVRMLDHIKESFTRYVSSHPFIPDNPQTVDERCSEIFNIQVAGLAKRMEHTGAKVAVLGISGGLDSTLALLVTAKTFEVLDLPPKNIICITMPGFGTTSHTYNSAMELMKGLNTSIREIDIKAACLQHFRDIGHDLKTYDITYENVQARERTQILMDIANKEGGLVIGTGDLSELALGWATYNGDHMSMYSVNNSIPKTLVRFLVKWVADNVSGESVKNVLYRIIDTPISPELLPPDAQGNINQKTEDTVGPYELHDFFIYYAVRFGMHPSKILFLASHAFKDRYDAEVIKKWLRVFYRRFFSQQFKRSCLPDGPKVGTVSLSPRGDWRMPSDADVNIWLEELDRA